MDDLLAQLNGTHGVAGSLVLSTDGLLVASQLRAGQDEDAIAAAAASLVSNAHTMAEKTVQTHHLIFMCRVTNRASSCLAAAPAF